MPTLTKGQLILNEQTGITGKFIAFWFNQHSGQWCVNVKVNGLTVSWAVL